jgi:hypothetical protein
MPKITPVTGQVQAGLDALVRERKIFHEQRIKLGHGLRKMRFLRNPQKPPKQFQAIFGSNSISAPLAFRHVQTVTGAIAKHRPSYHMVMNDPNNLELQSRGQRWSALMDQQMERQAQKPLWWKWVDNIVADGVGIRKFSRHTWEDFPKPEEDETDDAYTARIEQFLYQRPPCPLRSRIVDPLTVFFPTYEWEPGDVLETGYRSMKETMRSLRIAPINGNITTLKILEYGEPYPIDEVPLIPHGTMEVSELWTKDNVYFGVAGSWFEMENPYSGIIPYVITGGITTGNNDPSLEFMSTLFPFQRLQPWADVMLTAMVAWALTATNPILVTGKTPGPGVTGSQDAAIEEIPWGQNLDVGLGGVANFMVPPDVGPSIKGGIELVTSLMDRAALSPVVTGNIGPRSAGLAVAGAVENALAMLLPIVENMQIGKAEEAKMTFEFIKKVIKTPVHVSGFEMREEKGFKKEAETLFFGPEDVKGVADILVSMKQGSLAEDIQRGTHAAFMMEKGIWSEERAMLYSGVEDISKERNDKLKDNARRHPIVQQYLATQAVSDEPVLNALMEQAMQQEQSDFQPNPEQTPMPEDMQSGAGNFPGPAPRRGGRPTGSPSAGKKGPNQTNAYAGRR